MKKKFLILLLTTSWSVGAVASGQIECNVGYINVLGVNAAGPQKIVTVDQTSYYEIDLEDSEIRYQGAVQTLSKMGNSTDAIWLTANFKSNDQTITSSYWQQPGVGAELRFVAPKSLWIDGEKTFASFICTVR